MRFSGGVPNNGRGTLEVPRCAVERDRKEGALGASQEGGFVESVISVGMGLMQNRNFRLGNRPILVLGGTTG